MYYDVKESDIDCNIRTHELTSDKFSSPRYGFSVDPLLGDPILPALDRCGIAAPRPRKEMMGDD